MGRYYLPPQVLVLVAVLAAVGALLLVLARPAAGRRAASAERVESRPGSRGGAVRARRLRRGRRALAAAEPEPAPAPAPPRPRSRLPRPPARAGKRVALRARPGGEVSPGSTRTTEFGSPTTLAVAARRGRWLGVVSTLLPQRPARLGRLAGRQPFRKPRTRVSVTVDLSARRLVVRRGDRVLRRVTVAVGRPGSPTPDRPLRRHGQARRLRATAPRTAAASSRSQPTSRACRPVGGAATGSPSTGRNDPGSIGTAASAGCPRAGDADMRYLLRSRSARRPRLRPRVALAERAAPAARPRP